MGFCVGAWKERACFHADGESSIKERFGMQERDDRISWSLRRQRTEPDQSFPEDGSAAAMSV